ncbi:MAG: hypothetical protein COA86_02270 [Kangiella sp.]|nr:MAG: hypothetical protein COA86_02270 [Kangiella sp.]
MQSPESKIGKAFENYQDTYGVKALGHLLAKSLTAVTAQVSDGNVESGARIWAVKTEYVCGRVAVNFSPGIEGDTKRF